MHTHTHASEASKDSGVRACVRAHLAIVGSNVPELAQYGELKTHDVSRSRRSFESVCRVTHQTEAVSDNTTHARYTAHTTHTTHNKHTARQGLPHDTNPGQVFADDGEHGEKVEDVGQDVRRVREVGLLAHDLVDDVGQERLVLVEPRKVNLVAVAQTSLTTAAPHTRTTDAGRPPWAKNDTPNLMSCVMTKRTRFCRARSCVSLYSFMAPITSGSNMRISDLPLLSSAGPHFSVSRAQLCACACGGACAAGGRVTG
jgi:hypothetical protein